MSSGRPRVLVVCKGNHCRSPIAALIIAERSGGTLEVRSAGTRNWHVGKPAHPMMIEAAAWLGYDLTEHRGAVLDADLFAWADNLVAVDEETVHAVTKLAPGRSVVLLGAGIADPWDGPPSAYRQAAEEIERAAGDYVAQMI